LRAEIFRTFHAIKLKDGAVLAERVKDGIMHSSDKALEARTTSGCLQEILSRNYPWKC
jgi:hypothetical protein